MADNSSSINDTNISSQITGEESSDECRHLHWAYYIASSLISFAIGLSITLFCRLILWIKKRHTRKIQARIEARLKVLSALGNFGGPTNQEESVNLDIGTGIFKQLKVDKVVRSKTLMEGTLGERLAIAFARTQNFCERLQSGESTLGKGFV